MIKTVQQQSHFHYGQSPSSVKPTTEFPSRTHRPDPYSSKPSLRHPATQWTRLRHITRFHKNPIGQHFLTYWLPRLRVHMYDVCPGSTDPMIFRANSVKKKTDIVHCRTSTQVPSHPSVNWLWAEQHFHSPASAALWDDRRCILRLDSPLLNRGYLGGGILSDTTIPDVRCDDTAMNLWFEWKMLFSRMFAEEMALRQAREEAVNLVLHGLRVMKKDKRDEAVCTFLRENYAMLRGEVLKAFRSSSVPYRVTLPISPSHERTTHPGTATLIRRQFSMVFFVPGWETWSVRKIANYRAKEEKSEWNLLPCEIVSGDMTSEWWSALEKKWRGWEDVEERSEEELERELSGEIE
ncbi:hypothetical protein FB567DRAFT_579852 [Paraphoma chrysanthemicola]|uniref:Uncharacterized protein n=1 Tax=Paraphoma chrysanthemicola TaxID=798071 RepID=A0A8K0R651_9PLEO|nr:hypothetical protein FB567DRAFT_579852 [Paraphoma chrysanthemicola]